MNLNDVLMQVYQKDVALDDDLTKNCRKTVTEFMLCFLESMKQTDPLFNLLFKNQVFYGGSYYDNLKIGEATEFDLNIVIRLPFNEDNLVFNQSVQPGYVVVGLTHVLRELIPPHSTDYVLLNKIDNFLGHDNKLIPDKVRNWFEGVCSKARENASREMSRYNIQSLSLKKSGPALTLEIQTYLLPVIHIDLVPVIQKGVSGYDDVMYCVPKPHRSNLYLWRCSYPVKERVFLKNGGCAKVVIKLLKKMRDKQGWHKLASYYLKTVVMLTKSDARWEENMIGEHFIQTLESLSSYLTKGYIPFYHDNGCNLIENIQSSTLFNMNGRLCRIIESFKLFRYASPSEVIKYF